MRLPVIRNRSAEVISETFQSLNACLPIKQEVQREVDLDIDAAESGPKNTESRCTDVEHMVSWFQHSFGKKWNAHRMTKNSNHSPLFPTASNQWDTPDHSSIYTHVESKIDEFEAKIPRFVDRRLGSIIIGSETNSSSASFVSSDQEDLPEQEEDPLIDVLEGDDINEIVYV